MKKLPPFLLAVFLLVSGCGAPAAGPVQPEPSPTRTPSPSPIVESTAPSKTAEVPSARCNDFYPFVPDEGELAALIYLGGRDNVEAAEQYLVQTYPENFDLSLVESPYPEAEMEGYEYYLLLPRYQGTELRLTEMEMNEAGTLLPAEGKESVFARDVPLLFYCNFSDIVPSHEVRVTCGDRTIAFTPFVSLKDGAVQAADGIKILDLSQLEGQT